MKIILLSKLTLLFAFLTFKAQVGAQTSNYTLENADSLFKQYKLADSHQAYKQIASSALYTDSVRVIAYRKVAEQDWKFYRDYPDALRSLRSAKELKYDICAVTLQQAAVNITIKKYRDAQSEAEESLSLAKSDPEKINAEITYARAVLDESLDGKLYSLAKSRQGLKKASMILNHILEKQPGNPDASELLIGISLLLKDGNGVLNGWRSYYLVNDEQNINQVLKAGYFKLKPILVKWMGQQLAIGDLKALATGFADTKFFNYADFIVGEIKKGNTNSLYGSKELKDIAAYQHYIDAVQKVNDEIYPKVAFGKRNYEDEYDSLMNIPAKELWNKLSFTKKDVKFDPDSFYNIMNRKFDMEGYSGSTVNYYGMLMGHIVHKEPKQIIQYGYRTQFTYIAVDRLISRDFTSWYGTTNVGGWGDSATIIQVRKAYMAEPFELLSWMTDPGEQDRIVADIVAKKRADYAICRNDPYAEPKFLAGDLKFAEASKIYKHLTDSGLKGRPLNIAFIAEIFRLTIASTVFAHEGRHAIDQLYFPKEFKAMSDDERELRAKFSEVIYSSDPKMAFTGSILGSDLDEHTNHGKANKRFRMIIVEWMTAHQSSIAGLDRNVPLLMQFELLTDAQLIEICKSADPFAQ